MKMSTIEEIKDMLETLMKKESNEGIESIEVDNALSNPNDSGGSNSRSAVVKYENGSQQQLFLKICQDGSQHSFLNGCLKIFDKEIFFYLDLLPAICRFEKDKKDFSVSSSSVRELFFKCFGGECVNKDIIIVMEKFLPCEFYISSKENFHTLQQIYSIMKSIAIFHATSYCMKEIEGIDFLQKFKLLHDTLFNSVNHSIVDPFFTNNFKNHIKVLRAMKNEATKKNELLLNCSLSFSGLDEILLSRLDKLTPKLMLIMEKTLDSPADYNVVCHGDFHMWNIAFSNKGDMKAKYFDLQLIRYTSGLIDVHHYLSQVCTPATRNMHLQKFLDIYHKSFQETCNAFGIEEADCCYNKQMISSEYQQRSPWGFVFGFTYILPRYVSSDFYQLLDGLDKSEDILKLVAEKGSSNVWKILEMYVDMLQDDLNTIQLMEKIADKYD